MKHVIIELTPDSYIGNNVAVVINTNTEGSELAILLEEKMEAFIK